MKQIKPVNLESFQFGIPQIFKTVLAFLARQDLDSDALKKYKIFLKILP